MRKYATVAVFLVVALVALFGCAAPLAVTLQSPANGSTVDSLSPILAWTCSQNNASFRIQVASDGNFQNLVVDLSNLGAPSYTVPAGKLSEGQAYYWRVSATKGGQTSDWSTYWSFSTPPPTGTIYVNATLDDSAWSGAVSYAISGPKDSTGSSAPATFSSLPQGTYTISYSYGSPPGATLVSITPSPTQSLSSGGSMTFTLNFQTQATSTIYVNANLDGSRWSGKLSYTITGPYTDSSSTVPDTFSSLPRGTYTISYTSRGPSDATLVSITPSPTQTLSSGGSITFTFNFQTQASSTIYVNANLDGSSWSGFVSYTLSGPQDSSGSSVPTTFSNLLPGTYTLRYSSGGPIGATLVSITPSEKRSVSAGGSTSFTMNFSSQPTGTIYVNAFLDGSPWLGDVYYSVSGPYSDAKSYVPGMFTNCPTGTYTLSYGHGGPAGAVLSGITPSPRQSLPPGGSITFTLNFYTQATGTIYVYATLDGSPWQTAVGSGTISYAIQGPTSESSSTVPDSFSDLPPGSYTLSYNSGGPIGATLSSITPSARQNLPAGGSITFTLNFRSQPTGTVYVSATINGSPWSGSVSYTLAGPYTDSRSSAPATFSNCPSGSYTLSYSSGGPDDSVLDSITPSSRQNLSPGGTLTFTMNFVGLLVG
jgi:hypothetical protein